MLAPPGELAPLPRGNPGSATGVYVVLKAIGNSDSGKRHFLIATTCKSPFTPSESERKSKEPAKVIKEKKFKHQRNVFLPFSFSLLLGVNRP